MKENLEEEITVNSEGEVLCDLIKDYDPKYQLFTMWCGEQKRIAEFCYCSKYETCNYWQNREEYKKLESGGI